MTRSTRKNIMKLRKTSSSNIKNHIVKLTETHYAHHLHVNVAEQYNIQRGRDIVKAKLTKTIYRQSVHHHHQVVQMKKHTT